ncbi:MAG: pilus assembly protein TadG-related protein, partial [Gemmatimonadaceae bacterium]
MKRKKGIRRILCEQAQVLPLFALLMTGLFGAIGLSVDLGRAYKEKAELSRALDSAALAGAIELPDTTNATDKATQYMTINMPRATLLAPEIDVPAQKVTITAKSRVPTIFMRLLGISHVDVSASAQAGASNLGSSALPLDVELVLDDTGSMGSGCTNAQRNTPSAGQSSPVCPIGLTRNAAQAFLNILYPASGSPSSTQVGFNAFRGCYNAIPFKNGANNSVSV